MSICRNIVKAKRIKVYSVYTDEIRALKDIFVNSIKDDWEINIAYWDKFGEEGDFGTASFKKFTRNKVQFILKEIKQNLGDIIIWSDMDIQFFGRCTNLIVRALKDNDIVFLSEHWPRREINTGFMAIRCNERSLFLFEKVLSTNFEELKNHEQTAINNLLQNEAISISWDILPKQFWAMSHGGNPPLDIVLHHANCTFPFVKDGKKTGSIELKISQLEEIRKQVSSRKKLKWIYILKDFARKLLRSK